MEFNSTLETGETHNLLLYLVCFILAAVTLLKHFCIFDRDAPKKKKMAPGTVKIYNHVQLLPELSFTTSTPAYTLKLQLDSYLRRVKWDRSKRLLNGSLLLLTKDDCQTNYFATVTRRNVQELSQYGTFCITWEGDKPDFQKEDSYFDVLECDVYFESYRCDD